MAKTILELTAEELHSYRLEKEPNISEVTKHWEQGWEIARMAANLLRKKFGATRVVVFGSLTRRDWFTPWSDIDLAAWGVQAEHFYRAVAAVTSISPDFEVNLVDPEDCRLTVLQALEKEGVEI